MVAQDIPGDGVGLAAGQAGHDGLEVAVHDAGGAVAGQGAPVEAVGRLGLHDDELGRVVGEQVGEVAHHRAGQGAHARLDEHVGGTVDADLAELLGGLAGHGAVALHDPGGDLLIALPGGILNDHAVLGLGGLGGGHADAVVVVDLLNGDGGALLGNVVVTGLGAALGHMYHGLLPQLVGRPRHAAAVVAVGGGEEGGLAELLAEGLAGQVVVGHLGHVPAHLLGDVLGHGEGAAQHLEGVQAEAEGLVFDAQAGQTQVLGHAVQPVQGGDGVLGEGAVEKAGLGHVGERHDGQLPVVALGHGVEDPFDLVFHWDGRLQIILKLHLLFVLRDHHTTSRSDVKRIF